ncbi:MAG TPA: hypothetical protein VFS39_11325 [Nitrospira sp.]|nr:hypothetical protein [Nitrospira sp.]
MGYPLLPAFLLPLLVITPHGVLATGTEAVDAETPPIPFDDIDESTLQDEVSRQAAAFLHTVESHWGGDRDSIRRSVTGQVVREDDQDKLIYLRNITDHGVLEGYEFRHGSLVRGQYIVLQQPLNGLNEFIGYYQAVKQRLQDTYGGPVQDHVVWDNDLYQPLPDYWGVAVMIGHLRYRAEWETPYGTITLELTGNRHSRLFLEYKSRDGGALT